MADKLDFLDGLPLEVQEEILGLISKSGHKSHDISEKVPINIDGEVFIIPKEVSDLIECLHEDLKKIRHGV